jgi:hypothetical protein
MVSLTLLSRLGSLLSSRSGLSRRSSLLLGRGIGGSSVVGLGRSPESKVVTEQLHDKGRILVALLAESVELCLNTQKLERP